MEARAKAITKAVEALPPLRDVIEQYELRAKKALGQNFLLDLNLTDKIVRCAQERFQKQNQNQSWADAHVIEIGPGPGGLTRSLLKSGVGRVSAVEYDPRAVDALSSLQVAANGALEIISDDALKIDCASISNAPRLIIANLPYNIATPLLVNWLRQLRADCTAYSGMVLMFQKEVADRITARPDTKAYGRLGILTQWLCAAEKLFDLPPSAFTPPPKVTSAVVYFKPLELPSDAPPFESVERVTAAAFNQRRKMIRSSMKDYLPAIEALGIDPQRRAETLSVQEFLQIVKYSRLNVPLISSPAAHQENQ